MLNIEFDYRFDENGFFNDSARRSALETAGEIWSNLLQDDFEAIPRGAEFTTTNPTNGNLENVVLNREVDDLILFVGSGSLTDGISSSALKTSHVHPHDCSCGHCTQALATNLEDVENINDQSLILAQAQVNGTDLQGDIFQRRIDSETTDFEPWAGSISFNPSDQIDWNFEIENNSNDLSRIDFISVALHEIGHILGIGTAPIFAALGAGESFTGVNSLATNNGSGIPLEADLGHVEEGFADNSVLLDPLLNNNGNLTNRNLPGTIDLSLLADIGYEIADFTTIGSIPDLTTEQADSIVGSNLSDSIDALAGDDQVQGNDGDDTVNGGAGNDNLFGNAGADLLFGDSGTDSLVGGAGNDVLNGGSDSDLIFGSEGNDLLVGDDGNDELQGNEGNDVVNGGAGNDTLFGQDGIDFLSGNGGNDQLQGGEGNDSLQGNEGDDVIFGQNGNDLIGGGLGNDTVLGGAGNDTFFFAANNGADMINDFVVSEDVIQIDADLGFSNGDQLLAAITLISSVSNSDNTFSEVTLSPGNTIGIFHDTALTSNNFTVVEESSLELATFNVVDVETNSRGVTIQFDSPVNFANIDTSDLSLTRSSTGEEITGSLIASANNFEISFVSTESILTSDRYDLTLISSESGFSSTTGDLLNGDQNNIPGGNFVTQVAIDNDNQRILSLEDFNLTAGSSQNLEVGINDGAGITSLDFQVTYNSELLNINDVVINSALTSDWTITTENLSVPGTAIISLTGTTDLGAGAVDLLSLQANVPNTANNGMSDLVVIEEVSLNTGGISGIGTEAVQLVALAGDVSGDGILDSLDSLLTSQLAVGLSENFAAFANIDPLIVADRNQDGIISALDSFLITS